MEDMFKKYVGKHIRVSKIEHCGFVNIYEIIDVSIKHSIFPHIMFKITNIINKETFDISTDKLESYVYASEKDIYELKEYMKSKERYGK